MSRNDWDNQFGQDPKVLEQALDENAMNLTFVGAFALKDPLRDKVKSCVTYARENSCINVRLVSGDHINTATAYAYKSGVLKSEEVDAGEYVIMTGEDFRNAVGTLVLYRNSETGDNQYVVQNLTVFKQIASELKVLARATQEDKYILTVGLRNMEKIVAVTGEGVNDIESLY